MRRVYDRDKRLCLLDHAGVAPSARDEFLKIVAAIVARWMVDDRVCMDTIEMIATL